MAVLWLRPESLQQELEMSLRRLNTDYIDVYIVHWQEVAEYPCPISDTMAFLMKMKAQGKIRAIGASNLTREQFLAYANNGELDLIQGKYSMLDPEFAPNTVLNVRRKYRDG